MIEEIKKEIELYIIKNHKDRYDEMVDNIFEILDKYNNQPDYKSAWEELKERMNDDRFCPCFMDMQELEQKYNLGGLK